MIVVSIEYLKVIKVVSRIESENLELRNENMTLQLEIERLRGEDALPKTSSTNQDISNCE